MKRDFFKLLYICIAGLILIISALYLWPSYLVYQAEKQGQAELARANYNRKIMITEAKAKDSASIYYAAADTNRAHGIAISNRIIGRSLQDNPLYLQWLWIEQLEKANTIYIPTEGNFPITEAGRFPGTNFKKDTAR